ncbi:hypothetical protein OA848_05820 [Rickettsiales bacterium]|nr:hypothetical protein [Rickettsiales bacterium]
MIKKNIFFKLVTFFYLFSVQVALSNTLLYSHDENICKTDIDDSNLDCLTHCSLEQMENLDNLMNFPLLGEKKSLASDLKLMNQFFLQVAQKSHSPPNKL